MNTPHKHADVLRAIADGKAVQWQSEDFLGGWHDFYPTGVITPLTHQRHNWRIKPEPKPDVVRYGWITESTGCAEPICQHSSQHANARFVIDGETGKLKSAEVL